MSKICQITGKKAMIGNNVSHSKRRTKRTFDLNLFNKKFYYVEQDCWISLSICANGLRIINKKGLDAALKTTRVSDRTVFFLLGEVVEMDKTEKLFSMPTDKRTCRYRRGPESWTDTAPPVWCGYKRCPLPICGWDCPHEHLC